ncbi:hypothetical protein [Corynebacterium sp. HMSC034H07]|nr:hypothetical protein [Corynebacterium sp. HMSC034H07]
MIQLAKESWFATAANPAGTVTAFDMFAHDDSWLVAIGFGDVTG